MKRIITQILVLMLLFACSREEENAPGDGQKQLLSISAKLPELEISTKAATGTLPVYAFRGDELLSGTINPIAPALTNRNIYQYAIPDGTHNLLFSTFTTEGEGNYTVQSFDDGLMKIVQKDSVFTGIGGDLLLGYLPGVEAGNDQTYEVNMKRMVAKLKVELLVVIDKDTITEMAGLLDGAEVRMDGFAGELSCMTDGETGFGGETNLVLPLEYDARQGLSVDNIYTFPSLDSQHPLELKIIQPDGVERNFQVTVRQALCVNKYYTMTLYLRKNNADVSFSLADVVVRQSVVTNYNKDKSSMLNVSKESVFLGKEAGNTRKVAVTTRLSNWTSEITEGSEWLSMDRTEGVSGDSLALTTLAENTTAFRLGKVVITSGLYRQEILVQQSNGELQTITLDVSATGGVCNLDILGENYTVDFGNGEEPQKPYSTGYCNFSRYSGCGLVTIRGENLIAVIDRSGYDTYIGKVTLSNCYSLRILSLYGLREERPDFSGAPNLRELDCSNGLHTEIDFSANTKLEKLTCRSCPNIATLNVTAINSTLKELDCGNCDQLNILEIYPQDYSGVRGLEKLVLDGCDVFPGVNTNNYTMLKELNVNSCQQLGALTANNCTSLQKLDVQGCYNMASLSVKGCTSLTELYVEYLRGLSTLITTGCVNLETVDCGSCPELTGIDFSGYTRLKNLECGNCPKVTNISLAGCTGLQEFRMNNTYPERMDFTSCKNLPALSLDCQNTTQLLLDNCPSLKSLVLYYPRLNAFDPGVCPALENFELWNNTNTAGGLSQLDFSQNPRLRSVKISADNYLTELNLAACDTLESVDLYTCYKLRDLLLGGKHSLTDLSLKGYPYSEASGFLFDCLDLSGFDHLVNLTLEKLEGTATVLLNGCSALENYYGTNNAYISSISMEGCTGLKLFDCSNNPRVGMLNFSQCRNLTEVDCRYCAFTADGLNNMFESLPDRSNQVSMGKLRVSGNPGADACNQVIAIEKSWYFPNN